MWIWIVIGAAALLALAGLIEAARLRYIGIEIEDAKIPEAFDGMRMVFASDIHYGRNVMKASVKKTVANINALEPDYILLGGDYTEGLPYQTEKAFGILSGLKAKYGIYGVIGNHDIAAGKNEIIDAMKKAGIEPLVNDGVLLTHKGQSIALCGVDDMMFGEPNISRALRNTKADYVIALSHNPDYIEDIAIIRDDFKGPNVDFVFAGHTHGGQITFFNKFALMNANALGEKYRTGYKEHKGIKMYVSNGTGTSVLPFRFFSRPDMLVITLKHKEEAKPQ